jgi:hypothetical protein
MKTFITEKMKRVVSSMALVEKLLQDFDNDNFAVEVKEIMQDFNELRIHMELDDSHVIIVPPEETEDEDE